MDWASMAGIGAGAARGYEGMKTGIPQATPAQQPGQGPLMKYLHNRHKKPGDPPVPQPTGMPTDNPMPELATTQPVQPSMGPPNPYPPPGLDQQPPAFAQGSVVTKPTTAILGEDGPEMVVPLDGREDAKVSPSNLMKMNYQRRC